MSLLAGLRYLEYEVPKDFGKNLNIGEAEARLLWCGLSADTRSNYRTAIRSYEFCCRAKAFTPWPATTKSLANWISIRAFPEAGAGPQLRPGTLRSYLSALRFYHVDRQMPIDVFEKNEYLDRLIRGAERSFPWQKATRKPITKDILDEILTPYADSSSIDDININAAFALAHGGFMRMGEFTYKDQPDDITAARGLTRDDLIFAEDDSFVKIRLKQSKADRHFEGVTILVAASPTNCPVKLLRRLLEKDPTQPGRAGSQPLFRLTTGRFSFDAVSKILRARLATAGRVEKDFSGHSFRKGAATDAINNGLQEWEVQLLGRWKGDSVKLYYKMDPNRIYALSFQHQRGYAPAFTSEPPKQPRSAQTPLRPKRSFLAVS